MDPCGCDEFFSIFDRRAFEGDRERYRRNGPDRTTRMLLDLVRPSVGPGTSVLDVGGGIGIVAHELLGAGAGHAVLVDASPHAIAVARQHAREANRLDRIEFVEGDFVRRAAEVDDADVVTLDRVVCCYPDAAALVGRSAARARRLYALVLPRDRFVVRWGIRLLNMSFWLRRRRYRSYAHPNSVVDQLVGAAGLRPRAERRTFFWRVVAYERA